MNHFPTDYWTIHCTGEAMAQKYRITTCERCLGARVYSKKTPKSRCFRCGFVWDELTAIKQTKLSWRRCKLCNRQDMAGLSLKEAFCPRCRDLSASERKKFKKRLTDVQEGPKKINKTGPILGV